MAFMKKLKVWDKKNYIFFCNVLSESFCYYLVENGKIIDSFETLEEAIAFHESK